MVTGSNIKPNRLLDDFLLQLTKMRAYEKTPRRSIKNVRNWHYNHDYSAIDKVEQAYLFDEADDLISIVPRETTPLRSAIDGSLRVRTWKLWLDHGRTGRVAEHDAGAIEYYSDERMDAFVSAAIVAVGVSMLVIPLWILRSLAGREDMMLVVITVFILVFLCVLSFFMATKPFEALGATAA